MRKFFVREDDFVKIINKSVKNIKKIEPIKTGWTNFVFLVKTAHKKLIFRFPRNDFFRQALIKEKNFCDFLKTQNLKIKTPNMKLLYENGKPFSVHDQIKGRPLNECKLSERKKKKLAEDICDFVKHLSVLNYPTKLSKSSKFLKDLSKVNGENYDLSKHACLNEIEKKDKVVLTHGDLNPGNILIRKGKLYGKPMNRHDAERMLEELQGKMHQVITGVALLCLDEGVKRVFDVVTDVEFKSLSLKQIDEYIDLANPLDMAGAYGIQIYGGLIIEKIRGSYSNVVGLPLDELREVLDELKKRF